MKKMCCGLPHPPRGCALELLQRSTNGFSSLLGRVRRNWCIQRRSPMASRLDNAAANLTIMTLEPLVGLQLEGGTLPSAALACISRQPTLRRLVLKDVEIVGANRGLEFLRRMKNLEELVIDNCPDLTTESFRPLASLRRLKHLALGLDQLDKENFLHLTMCDVEVSLTLRGSRDLTEIDWLNATLNLVELRFEGFGQSDFPFWVARSSTLRSLSFDNGVFNGLQECLRAFPGSMRSLSIVNCKIGYPLLNCLLSSSGNLTDAELCLTVFHDKVDVEHLQNVRTLKVYGEKELDGEILEKLSRLRNLEELHVAGCLCLKEHHLSQLRSLPNLKCLRLGSCYLRGGSCEILFSIDTLSQLTFNSCCGLSFKRLHEATALSSLRIVKCLSVDVDFLFTSRLPEHLNDFKYEPNV